ncbi:MAG: RNA polymerase sigma factor [Candidatus Omnitrophica bacterium]|nr:RNA polymerase sigma factor [Candidatus Omnitrophota bacterium]
MYSRNEDTIKSLVAQYQQKLFTFVLYLIGQDQDRAYDICVDSFVEVIRKGPSLEQKDAFLTRLFSLAVTKSRSTKAIPGLSMPGLLDISSAEKESLRIVAEALQSLDFDEKSVLLLHYQLNFSYEEMAAMMKVSEQSARRTAIEAEMQIRKKIDEIMNRAGRN